MKIFKDPQLLLYVPTAYSSRINTKKKKSRIKEAFILTEKKRTPTASLPPLLCPDLAAPRLPPVVTTRERRPSVCSGVDPLQPLFRQVSVLPRKRFLDFDSLALSDDFSQLISLPQFENLVQSFVILKQKAPEVGSENNFFYLLITTK